MGGSGNPGLRLHDTRKKGTQVNKRNKTVTQCTKIQQKVRNSNKRYENRREGTKFKGKYAKRRNGTFFSVSQKTRNTFFIFFQFRKTIETRRNSDLFRTVSFFAKKTVHPSYVPFSSVQCTHVFSLCVQNMHNCTLLIVSFFSSLDCLSCSIYTLKGGNV